MLRGLLSRLLELAVRILPKRSHVVVYGYPNSEGNAVETVRALSKRYRGVIYWLDGPSDMREFISDSTNVVCVKRLSLGAILRYVTAEVVFYTHGLYGNPSPSRRQPIINLWHGDGIKAQNEIVPSKRSVAPATYVVGGTKLLTARKAFDFKMASDAVIVSGNPRIDQFQSKPSPESLAALGIDDARPFVLWMPTFRRARQVGITPAWTDSGSAASQMSDQIQNCLAVLNEYDIQLVVKPHPLDAESYRVNGSILLSNEDISDAGTTLYQLLGASSGLISDYSSVWTDYLVLDKPIAFVIPDKQEYASGRGVYPSDAVEWLPGNEIKKESDVHAFVSEILGQGSSTADLRSRAADRLGLVRPEALAADALLDRLEELRVFRRNKSVQRENASSLQS